MTARIFVRFTHAGMHRWPDAPAHRAYLRDPHRHLFHVHVETDVTHDDREIEFHDLLEEARFRFEALLFSSFNNTPSASCEMLARKLGEGMADTYGRAFTVTVSEDNECGATVQIEKAPPG